MNFYDVLIVVRTDVYKSIEKHKIYSLNIKYRIIIQTNFSHLLFYKQNIILLILKNKIMESLYI